MYISLHCNSAINTEARGVEVYYFTSFSQPLAKAINNELAAFYENSVYCDGVSRSRGDKYSYYWVTLEQDFPSVLVEMGFISNETECMAMANEINQEGMAAAIANGVYSYFSRSNISYSGNGSDSVPEDSSDTGESEDASEPEAPSETTEAEDIVDTTEADDIVE